MMGLRSFGRRLRHGSIAAAFASGFVLSAAPAHSATAEPSPTELAVARRLFSEAVEFEKAERWALAASKLRDAIAIKDTPGLRFHLAHCEEKQEHLVEALLNYDHARELITAGAHAPDVDAVLDTARAALDRRIPYLVLVPPGEVANLEVEIDGQLVARSLLGRAAPVDPKPHHVVARAPGYRGFAAEITVAEGERRTVQLRLQPLASAAETTAVAADTGRAPLSVQPNRSGSDRVTNSSSARTTVLVAESAFTVAALGVGIGFWLVKDTAADRVRHAQGAVDQAAGGASTASCAGPATAQLVSTCRELRNATSNYDRAYTLSVVGLAGTGVGAAATVLTFVLWPSSPVVPHVEVTSRGHFLKLGGRF